MNFSSNLQLGSGRPAPIDDNHPALKAYLARGGKIKYCPTAPVAPTTAVLGIEDAAALTRHRESLESLDAEKENKPRRKGGRLTNDERASRRRMALEHLAQIESAEPGLNQTQIAARLNALGVAAPTKSAPWTRDSVSILQREHRQATQPSQLRD